jgi:hypothetical protein
MSGLPRVQTGQTEAGASGAIVLALRLLGAGPHRLHSFPPIIR